MSEEEYREPWQFEGSVSYGTHRKSTLIPAFLDALRLISETEEVEINIPEELVVIEQICAYFPDLIDYPNYYTHAEFVDTVSYYAHEWLYDQLNALAPEGYSFGASEGNGADFGFWHYGEEGE